MRYWQLVKGLAMIVGGWGIIVYGFATFRPVLEFYGTQERLARFEEWLPLIALVVPFGWGFFVSILGGLLVIGYGEETKKKRRNAPD